MKNKQTVQFRRTEKIYHSVKKIVKAILPNSILNLWSGLSEKLKNYQEINNWKKNGKPSPPPHRIKQLAIEYYQKKYGIDVFVETGTYLGHMVSAQLKNFKRIYSIELGYDLWENAVKKFGNYDHVKILQGDSGLILKDVVLEIKEQAIFWLDGHYSAGITAKGEKDCPIFEELNAIFTSKFNHILLIDDARCFNGEGDYPTINELAEYVLSERKGSHIEIKDDSIRVELR